MNLKIKRTQNRRYRNGDRKDDLLSPSEYAVYRGKELIARILKMGEGWRACRPSEGSKIGTAISPIGMNKFREVKTWTLLKLKKQQQGS
jgi:hypothetical protein